MNEPLQNYIQLLEEENSRLKSQSQIKPVMKQWLELERLKYSTMLIFIGLFIGYLILPSPIALLFPKPIQGALKNVSCGTNAVYQRLGI